MRPWRSTLAAWGSRRRRGALFAVAVVAVAVCGLAGVLALPRPHRVERAALEPKAADVAPDRSAVELVQRALAGWMQPAAGATLHQTVRAVDLTRSPAETVTTELWIAPGAAHRVEVRNEHRLLEWQAGDGEQRLQYVAGAADSSCPWALPLEGRTATDAVAIALGAEEQSAVRDARLRQGALGVGYHLLEQAAAAPDLRVLGERRENGTAFTLLSYRTPPGGQYDEIVLQIDGRLGQLYAAQGVAPDGDVASAHELWRVLSTEHTHDGVPLDGQTPPLTSDRLLDPACPAIGPGDVAGLRTLIDAPGSAWYLPAELPPGVDSGLVWAQTGHSSPNEHFLAPLEYSAVLRGPDRWLRLGAARWRPNTGDADDTQLGAWRVALTQRDDGSWSGLALRAQQAGAPAYVPAVALAGYGFKRDELLAAVEALEPVTARTWQALGAAFVDPAPAAPEAAQLLSRALSALEPAAGTTVASRERIWTRTRPPDALTDPYHLPSELRTPDLLLREQQLEAGAAIPRFSDILFRGDGSVWLAQTNDGQRLTFDDRAGGWIGSEPAGSQAAEAAPREAALDMLEALLSHPEPIVVQHTDDGALLTQTAGWTACGLGGGCAAGSLLADEFRGQLLPTPWTADLRGSRLVRRLLLDANSVPRRLEIALVGDAGDQALLRRVELVERRVQPGAPAATALPPVAADVLRFNATALRWRQALSERALLPMAWLMSSTNFDAAAQSTLADSELPELRIRRVLGWNNGDDATLMWQQLPASSPAQLNVGTRQAGSWRDLTNVPALHRSQWQTAAGQIITVTQGSRRLIENVLRYPSSDDTWSRSERLEVTIDGRPRQAWLLRDDTYRVAALVVEVDGQLVHIVGPAPYLHGALRDALATLQWSPLEQADQ